MKEQSAQFLYKVEEDEEEEEGDEFEVANMKLSHTFIRLTRLSAPVYCISF